MKIYLLDFKSHTICQIILEYMHCGSTVRADIDNEGFLSSFFWFLTIILWLEFRVRVLILICIGPFFPSFAYITWIWVGRVQCLHEHYFLSLLSRTDIFLFTSGSISVQGLKNFFFPQSVSILEYISLGFS